MTGSHVECVLESDHLESAKIASTVVWPSPLCSFAAELQIRSRWKSLDNKGLKRSQSMKGGSWIMSFPPLIWCPKSKCFLFQNLFYQILPESLQFFQENHEPRSPAARHWESLAGQTQQLLPWFLILYILQTWVTSSSYSKPTMDSYG